MPFTVRPYRRFLPLVCCSGVWSLITVLLLSVGPVYAEWVLISLDEERAVYVDPDTVRRKGDLVKVWHLFDFKAVQTVAGHKFLSMHLQSEFDCAEERFRQLAMTTFFGNMVSGDVTYTQSVEGAWDPIPPETTVQILWKLACGKM